ncbi:hypothetical protein AgCh_009853 [Apium graveolens]
MTSSTLACDFAKVVCALIPMEKEGNLRKIIKKWTLVDSLTLSGLSKQSIQQIGAPFLLIVAAILHCIGEGSRKGSTSRDPDEIILYGIVLVLMASDRTHDSYTTTAEKDSGTASKEQPRHQELSFGTRRGSPSLGLGAPRFTFISKLLKESISLTCKNPRN